MRTYSEMFRPNYDMGAGSAWLAGLGSLVVTQPPLWAAPALVAAGMAAWRFKQAADLYRFRLSLTNYRVELKPLQELLNISHEMYQDGTLFLGNGFKWEQKHTEIATKILRRSSAEIPEIPDWIPEKVVKKLSPKSWMPVRDGAIGVPWIHGIEPEDHPIGVRFDALEGHTLLCGTTRAGKTRLYELIVTQLIYQRKTVFIIDPKGDKDLEKRCRKECAQTGRKFLFFHPARPSESMRLDPLANWNTVSDAATRVGQLVEADASFASFAWKTLNTVLRGMVANEERPNIKKAKRYVQLGIEPLLTSVLAKWFVRHHERKATWDQDLKGHMNPKDARKIVAMMSLYREMTDKSGQSDETIDAMIAMVEHSKEHFSKMIQVLEPVLEQLGAGELGDMLSPDPTDLTDTRPIYDTRKCIEENAVVYIALDSLSNRIIGSAIGSIILADLASVAGAIYNFEEKKDVFLLVDEAAEAMNDQLIQILNKGGGAGMKCLLATQTIADFTVRLGSKDKATQVLANLNNVISLRVKDYETAEWVAKSFGKTGYRAQSESMSTSSGSAAHPTEFNASTSRSVQEQEVALVNPDLLMRLPPFNYFAFVAGSTVYKGRFPIIN